MAASQEEPRVHSWVLRRPDDQDNVQHPWIFRVWRRRLHGHVEYFGVVYYRNCQSYVQISASQFLLDLLDPERQYNHVDLLPLVVNILHDPTSYFPIDLVDDQLADAYFKQLVDRGFVPAPQHPPLPLGGYRLYLAPRFQWDLLVTMDGEGHAHRYDTRSATRSSRCTPPTSRFSKYADPNHLNASSPPVQEFQPAERWDIRSRCSPGGGTIVLYGNKLLQCTGPILDDELPPLSDSPIRLVSPSLYVIPWKESSPAERITEQQMPRMPAMAESSRAQYTAAEKGKAVASEDPSPAAMNAENQQPERSGGVSGGCECPTGGNKQRTLEVDAAGTHLEQEIEWNVDIIARIPCEERSIHRRR
ncbi:hypothetical protein SELMODRAFT_428221 [Selaginella moellendorffii]|uniref:Uncharacterized protein n=1 Tax=Selaginella moellendorffii TaxID=88036 RepID=D8T249_SELML|nr:hypothetical protein SELMODRAFT_428221 [Selaginella moellendorffii]